MPTARSSASLENSNREAGSTRIVALWALNWLLLIGCCVWILGDGRSHQLMRAFPLTTRADAEFAQPVIRDWSPMSTALTVLTTVLGAALVSAVAIFASLFVGPQKCRSMRAWLGFVLLISCWLALWVSWPTLYWLGQQVRVRGQLEGFKPLVTQLRESWPADDGENSILGRFLAYPKGKPQTLLLIGNREVTGTNLSIAAVERSADGALLFQLAGAETGAWLEWHPPGSAPESFLSGIETQYQLLRTKTLDHQWYLARYQAEASQIQ